MSPSPDEQEKLEQLVHRTLRELPPRRAPRSLERRVLVEIDRRAALPWWRKSFGHWPIGARAGFILMCTGLVKLAWTAGVWVVGGLDTAQFKEAFAQPFNWMEAALAVFSAITGSFGIVLRNIPPLWLYGGLIFFASMYALLFGLGAAAYKAISTER